MARWWESDAALRRIGFVPLGCIIGLVFVLSVGVVTWRSSTTYGHNAHAHARNVGAVPVARASVAPPPVPLSPTRIEIPKLQAVAPIVPVITSGDGELEVPQNPRTVGWWSPGARPGAAKGTAILAGHINYAGVAGALGRIGELAPGDQVRIFGTVNANAAKEVQFTVTGVRTYHKTRLPYAEIFSQQSIGRIAIVTCGGPFDAATGNYLDNIVVYAVPTRVL